MVFSSIVFIFCFLPVVYGINYLCRRKLSNLILLIASIVFYAWGEPIYVVLIVVSIFLNYIIGILIGITSNKTVKKCGLIAGVFTDLLILGYYKYSGLLIGIWNFLWGGDYPVFYSVVALPIGISFFTFQEISYLVDVYRKETSYSKKFIDVALYISFFPQLIAGPIVKYRDISEHIYCRKITFAGTTDGYKRFIYGLSKKVLIANILGSFVDKIYVIELSEMSSLVAWAGAIAYTFQIYYDFSGYSDMAIGLGRMLGFGLPENFNYPYLSHSITEFWRRWHITLGAWFKDYVYIPLGGNRLGDLRTSVNLIIVFCLTGLWHGADISYLFWGLLNGLFAVIERTWMGSWLKCHRVLSAVYCFALINFGWVIFRAGSISYAMGVIGRMILPWKHMNGIGIEEYLNMKIVVVIFGAILGAGMLQKLIPSEVKKKWNGSIAEGLYCIVILLLSIASIASGTYNPFIYFQF